MYKSIYIYIIYNIYILLYIIYFIIYILLYIIYYILYIMYYVLYILYIYICVLYKLSLANINHSCDHHVSNVMSHEVSKWTSNHPRNGAKMANFSKDQGSKDPKW